MIQQTLSWLIDYQTLLTWLGISSLLMFVLSLLLLPWFIKKIPADYFQRPPKANTLSDLLTPLNLMRNTLGGLVLIAGIAMLILPGQGLLTVFAGIAIMHFPGKYQLERWLISRNGILKAVNWLRRKTDTPELK
ncbi:MAG: Unknown protein, partial [uncultured Thiotrichaceae bacterium]